MIITNTTRFVGEKAHLWVCNRCEAEMIITNILRYLLGKPGIYGFAQTGFLIMITEIMITPTKFVGVKGILEMDSVSLYYAQENVNC